MADPASGESSSHSDWDAFSRRHAGCPHLAYDPLYSLSNPLIESIHRHIPGFFTTDEELFERELARAVGFGFFLHRPLGFPPDAVRHGRPLRAWQEETSQKLKQMLAEELRRAGADPEDVREYFERGTDRRERIASRQAAYAGWLVLNLEFRDEVRRLRERWGDAVRVVGRFPRLPLHWIPDPTVQAACPPGFRDEFYAFYCRWGLDTLATWDWPIPMEPDLSIGQLRDHDLHSSGGLCMFVPWYMLRGGKFDLREVVQQSRIGSAPDHLRDWVNKRTDRQGRDLGDVRFATIRWLYRYHELVLVRRYADACGGNRQRLDRAFADVLQRDEDTVKKLRRELRRAFGGSAPGQSSV